MGVISGKRAVMASVGSLRRWTIRRNIDPKSAYASSTDGMPIVVVGNKDWSGSAEFYGYTPAIMPGAGFTFQGNPDTGTTGIWTGTAIVDSISVSIPVESGEPISGVINFSGNGELTTSTATISDATSPTMYPSKSRAVLFAGTDVANVVQMDFTISAANQQYATGGSSGTSGIIKRVAGNLSASGSFRVKEGLPSAVLAYGTFDILKYYVTASLFWEFKYAVIGGNDHQGERESGAIPTYTYDWTYSGFSEDGATKGYIKNPATTAFWP